MPRPKRSKVAPSASAQLQHRHTQPATATSAAQKERKIISLESAGCVTNGSDDSDGLVVSKKINGSKKTPMAGKYTMSGALAPEDIGSTRLKPPSGQTRAALSKIVRESDYAKAKEENSRKAAQEYLSAEPEQIHSTASTNTLKSRRPSTDLGHSSARQSLLAVSGPRIQETPRLHSSSSLVGATFKKRPRQPSLLQMVQSQNNASDDLDDNDMYGFLPDDESTPLIKSLSQTNTQCKSSSQQTNGSRKRKMKSPEIQVPASQSFNILSSPSAVLSQSDRQQSLTEEDDRPEPTLPPLRSTQTPRPEVFSDTLAPPQSSSSPREPKKNNAREKPAKVPNKARAQPHRTRRKQLSPAPSPLSSTSTQVSPVRPAKVKPLTTANLQNLLPRRRAPPKPKAGYDIPSSSDVELDNTPLGEDEDELSFHATSKIQRKKSTMSTGAQKRGGKGKEMGAGGKGKRISKTYTRKSVMESGDENESGSGSDDDDDGGRSNTRGRSKTPALDSKAKAEMKRLAEKFREVDEYTLDFEDMTGSSSQLKDAR